jgi:hypothetical protein
MPATPDDAGNHDRDLFRRHLGSIVIALSISASSSVHVCSNSMRHLRLIVFALSPLSWSSST